MEKTNLICVGLIAGAHGLRGQVRLRSFTDDPEDIFVYKPLTDEKGGRDFAIKQLGAAKGDYIVAIKGVDNRDAAEALRGAKLFFDRARLPKVKKGQYYEADLVGLAVQDAQGKAYGKILATHDYGAGPFLEIGTGKKDSFMLPFTDACVPDVDIKGKIAKIEIPEGWLNKQKR